MRDRKEINPCLSIIPMVLAGLVLAIAVVAGGILDIPIPGWAQVVLCFGFSGAFGGILASIQHIHLPGLLASAEKDHWSSDRFRNVTLALLIGAVGGVGGAGAALFVMLLDGKIKVPLDDLGRLSAITSGLLGGFVGFQLLKRVAEQTLDPKAREEVKSLGGAAGASAGEEAAIRVTAPLAQLQEAAFDGIIALSDQEHRRKEAILEAIPRLEKLWSEHPDNRVAAITLGRLYRAAGNLQKAIEILTKAHSAMARGDDGRLDDLGALLFNRACYWCLLAKDLSGQAAADAKENCYVDLEDSIKNFDQNARQAAVDTDFESIKQEERFKVLLARHGGSV